MNIIRVLTSLTGRAAPTVERRAHDRIPAHERGIVCWKDHLGLPKAHSITIVNVSSGGIAFASQDHLSKDQAITVVTASRSLDCIVRHVRKTGRGYYLGAEVAAVATGVDAMSAMQGMTGEPGGK